MGVLFLILSVFAAELHAGGDLILRVPNESAKKNVMKLMGQSMRFESLGETGFWAVLDSKALDSSQREVLKDYLQPNFKYSQSEINDPELKRSWGLINSGQVVEEVVGLSHRDIGLEESLRVWRGDSSFTIAILDSGVERNHPELSDRIWQNPNEIAANGVDEDENGLVDDVEGWNVIDGNADISDTSGHGTLVAGIIGARAENGHGSRGIMDHVSIMVVKCFDRHGIGSTAAAIRAIQYAVMKGAQVLNASWGGPNYDPALFEVLKWANSKGVLVVTSSGNDGRDNDRYPVYPASFSLPNLISVAAYNARDERAEFSNYGKSSVEIAGPGVGIFGPSSGNSYRVASGTSFATPFVSGVAGLLWSYRPELSAHEIKTRLLATSSVISYYEKESLKSAGRVHAGNALMDTKSLRPQSPERWHSTPQQWQTKHPYSNSEVIQKVIHVPNATRLRLHFSEFQTEEGYDWVVLRDAKARVVGKYSGDLGAFDSADVLGDSMVIEFKSDDARTYQGVTVDRVDMSFERTPWETDLTAGY